MADFHPAVGRWFARAYGEPSPPQTLGWPEISAGNNTLILAPTGSGKTLAAFLWAINHLVEQHAREALPPGVRILYVSPLKALNNDIERNLEGPLRGIEEEIARDGITIPGIRTAVRTGDTPARERASMIRTPPDILITTPESLYLMVTGMRARPMFRTVQYVIVDEIHAICGNKRGVHLSLTLERLQEIAEQEFVRIGLSATQRPLEKIAAFLGGQTTTDGLAVPRPVSIVDAGGKKSMDLRVTCAAPDFSLLPQETIWPMVFTELLALIRTHTTTLIFVNNRRLAERVAATLNAMVAEEPVREGPPSFNLYAVPVETPAAEGELLVQAYHGSMSREAREGMETALKAGRLRALVSTSALELGIDIGSIDLVVQLQSPKGVARGLQRVGRSGHVMNATSKGRMFPTHREDLVETAVVARAMTQHDVERTAIPENCLDVLAQQIVAIVSVEERDVDGLFDLVRRSSCYRALPRALFDGVIRMLAGRYTSEAFRGLKARVSWDKVNGVLRTLPGSAQLAVTSGGTIADKGYFGVFLGDGSTRVGEVDEEFVYETRPGDTFILGSSVWRVEGIDANRLTVSPAPGQPARMPFWRGEGLGRTFELGVKVGEFREMMAGLLDEPDCLVRLRDEFPLDAAGAWNIREYFRKQRESTGVIPGNRLILVEGFRDEIGDPRLVIHSTFGRRVNGLLGLVLARRLRELTGVEPQLLSNDDAVLLRSSDAESLPLNLLEGVTADTAQNIVLEDILTSSLFGGQFRQNAARALLMPRSMPGKRTPLWLQRLRAGDLLQIARRYDDFPIVIETMREVLHDVLDFDNFLDVIRGVETGEIRVETALTETPSPFASSVLFDFIAVYMYEWDQPKAAARGEFLPVNRDVLGEIVNIDSPPPVLRPDAIIQVEAQAQHTAPGSRARSPEELMDLLVRVGDLDDEEIRARVDGDAGTMILALERDGRAIRAGFPGGTRWIAGEDRETYDALPGISSATAVLARFFRTRGPVTTAEVSARYGMPAAQVENVARTLEKEREVVHGLFRRLTGDGQDELQWCSRGTLTQMHRRSIAIARREITPVPPAEFTRFLLEWQGVGSGRIDLPGALDQLQGLPLPAEVWERDVLRARVPGFSQELLAQYTAAGNGLWVGSPAGKVRFLFRGNGSLFLPPPPDGEPAAGEAASRVQGFLERHGASFFGDIREGTRLSLGGLNDGIAALFWNGAVTNDVFAEVMSVKQAPRKDAESPVDRVELVNPHRAPGRARALQSVRRALRQVPGWTGRWSLVRVPGAMGPDAHPDQIAAAQAQQLLHRYGIVAREFLQREEFLPWAAVATVFQRMEMRGEIRRGYFVEGLSGMQFALPEAADLLRRLSSSASLSHPVIVNACDPANPYGTGVNMPPLGGTTPPLRLSRIPGNYLVFASGLPVLVVESYGARLRTVGSPAGPTLRDALTLFVALMRLPEPLRPFKEIIVEYCDDVRPAESPLAPALRSLGFIGDRNQTMRRDRYQS